MRTVAVEDSTLELMTQSLLKISSVFLVQQNELQAVRDRLAKELSRVTLILETLAVAAQQHQDAVSGRNAVRGVAPFCRALDFAP